MLDAGYRRIVFDGSTVRADRRSRDEPTEDDLTALKAVRDASARPSDVQSSRTGDAFVWKAFVVEGVIWSIAGYAIGAALDLAIHREDFHVSSGRLWELGLLVAQAVADMNRSLDRAEPAIVERTYARCETRRHRGRRQPAWQGRAKARPSF